MKKAVALLLALVMVLALCACGKSNAASPDALSEKESGAIEETDKHITNKECVIVYGEGKTEEVDGEVDYIQFTASGEKSNSKKVLILSVAEAVLYTIASIVCLTGRWFLGSYCFDFVPGLFFYIIVSLLSSILISAFAYFTCRGLPCFLLDCGYIIHYYLCNVYSQNTQISVYHFVKFIH